jgi:hypothetical protein
MAPRNNYGSLGNDDRPFELDDETKGLLGNGSPPLVTGAAGRKEFDDIGTSSTSKRIGVALLLVGALVAVPATYFGFAHSTTKTTENHNHNGVVDILSKESLLSPNEMGFETVEREQAQSPGRAWGSRLLQSGKPLPTNSWYLVSTVLYCTVLYFLFIWRWRSLCVSRFCNFLLLPLRLFTNALLLLLLYLH